MKNLATTFICFFGLLMGQTSAQCDLVITSAGASENCSDTGLPSMQVYWTGGTPPYTMNAVTTSGYVYQGATSNDHWFAGIGTGIPGLDRDANITITDALGCVATTYISWVTYYPVEPEITLTADCVLGGILQWTGRYDVGGGSGTGQYLSCFGTGGYTIINMTTNALVQSGEIAADWVQGSGTTWHYPGYLPAGYYNVYIGPPSGECNFGPQTICYRIAYFTVPASPGNCGTNFSLRAALAGALPSGTLMTDQLRSANVIPSVEPYSALGYTYTGSTAGATVQPSVLAVTGNNAIVDWVIVELRSASNPATILYSRPALIQRDGDVVGLNGSSSINTSLAAGNYRVAIRHRNHLGVMTAASVVLSSTPATIDFTNAATAMYGTNARTLIGTVMCLWPGDANFDGTAIYTGTNNDRDIILQTIGGVVPTATRVAQLP